MLLCDGTHPVHPGQARLDPARGPEQAMVTLAESVAGSHIVVEQPAVIDHAGDNLDLMFDSRRQAEAPRPRFEWMEDDHRPVEQRAESPEAQDQSERKSVCRP